MHRPDPRRSDAFDPEDPDHRAILEVIRADVGAFLAKDIDALSACYVQDDRMTSLILQPTRGLQRHVGFDAFREAMKQGMDAAPEPSRARVEQRNLRINVSGNMAWAIFEEVVERTGDTVEPPNLSHNMRVFERRDGVWKICFHSVFEPRQSYAKGPLIEVDEAGRVLWMNDAASAGLKVSRHLLVSGGRLTSAMRGRSGAFREAIRRAGRLQSFQAYNAALGDTEQRAVFPVLLDDADEGELAFCLVSVVDYRIWVSFGEAVQIARRLKVAAIMFGLSDAQQVLAGHIAEGRSVPEAAVAMEVSANTARTHLKRLFDKTGVHSQPALLRVLLSVG